jgi:hypothetical protein
LVNKLGNGRNFSGQSIFLILQAGFVKADIAGDSPARNLESRDRLIK